VEDLKRVSKQLRSLPYVEPQLPTLALVGAPNVGKSSLVQVRSGLGAGPFLGAFRALDAFSFACLGGFETLGVICCPIDALCAV
jgi:hypothetical protein